MDTREQWVTAQDLKGHCFRVHYDKLAICTGSQVGLPLPSCACHDGCWSHCKLMRATLMPWKAEQVDRLHVLDAWPEILTSQLR